MAIIMVMNLSCDATPIKMVRASTVIYNLKMSAVQYIHIYIYIYMCVYIYIYIYIHMYVHPLSPLELPTAIPAMASVPSKISEFPGHPALLLRRSHGSGSHARPGQK